MLNFWQWIITNHNYIVVSLWFVFFGYFGISAFKGDSKWIRKAVLATIIPATLMIYVTAYQGDYRYYKNHWKTCDKQAAKEWGYYFDPSVEKCYKPFTGYVPVDAREGSSVKGEVQ